MISCLKTDAKIANILAKNDHTSLLKEQLSEELESGKSDKSCKCNAALSCCESNCTARCATVTEPSHRVSDPVPFLFCFGKLFCISKFILVFLICIISTANVFFPFVSIYPEKKAQKLHCCFSLCSCEILPSNALTWLSQACSRVKSGSLPQLHSLLQIHANLQSSVI